MNIELFKNLPRDLWSKIIIFMCQMRIIECYKKISNGHDFRNKFMYLHKIYKGDFLNNKIVQINLQYFKVPQLIRFRFYPTYKNIKEQYKSIVESFDLLFDKEILSKLIDNELHKIQGNLFYFYLVGRNIKAFVILDIDYNYYNLDEVTLEYVIFGDCYKILLNEIINTEEFGELFKDDLIKQKIL
jgi:hypothetical protein